MRAIKRPSISVALLLTLAVSACQQESATTADEPADVAQHMEPTTTHGDTSPSGPLASTSHGPVVGTTADNISVFKGVRYGADTFTTRFQAPDAPEAWTTPAMADRFGPACPQPTFARTSVFKSWIPEDDTGQSEDCLFLNVWTPGLDSKQRPVMVWLHGGGFTTGSGSSNAYDGTRLADRGDVVVVTVNHRLNLFGYLYLDEFGEQFQGSANAGMMDLVAALGWVRDNIENFGGDPDNVLIFGESGGGWKVSTLMAMDAAVGLFHRAVAQSGPGLTLMETTEAQPQTEALLAALEIDAADVDQILTVPTERLVAAFSTLSAEAGGAPGRRPVIDGVHNLRHPFTPAAPEQSKDVPLLIGSTQHENSLLMGARRPELFDLTWEALPAAINTVYPDMDAQAVIDGYRSLHPQISAADLFFEATTDHGIFGRGSFTLADRKADQGGAPVYQYYMTWRSPVEGGKWGAMHALDIGFVFDNVALSESMSGTGEEQQALADVMSEAWLAFARSGDPNHKGLPEWPTYNAETRATMIFDNEPKVVNDPRARERAILDGAATTAGGR